MNCSTLSNPLAIQHQKNYHENIIHIYETVFLRTRTFGLQKSLLLGKLIKFTNHKIDEKFEIFWHLISYNSIDDKFGVSPCVNLPMQQYCILEKQRCAATRSMPFNGNLKNRVECYYRMTTIHWIDEVLNLANNNDPHIMLWKTQKRLRNGGGYDTFLHLRFVEDTVDYIVVLKELYEGKEYQLITAYPVTLNGSKHKFDAEYQKYKKEQKK